MRKTFYLFFIAVFAGFAYLLLPALALVGAGIGWITATGILWAYDDALQGGAQMHNNYWIHGSDGVDSIFNFNGFDTSSSSGDGGGGGD